MMNNISGIVFSNNLYNYELPSEEILNSISVRFQNYIELFEYISSIIIEHPNMFYDFQIIQQYFYNLIIEFEQRLNIILSEDERNILSYYYYMIAHRDNLDMNFYNLFIYNSMSDIKYIQYIKYAIEVQILSNLLFNNEMDELTKNLIDRIQINNVTFNNYNPLE